MTASHKNIVLEGIDPIPSHRNVFLELSSVVPAFDGVPVSVAFLKAQSDTL